MFIHLTINLHYMSLMCPLWVSFIFMCLIHASNKVDGYHFITMGIRERLCYAWYERPNVNYSYPSRCLNP